MEILIADDHSVAREGLRAMIERLEDMQVVIEAADGLDRAAPDQTQTLKWSMQFIAEGGELGAAKTWPASVIHGQLPSNG